MITEGLLWDCSISVGRVPFIMNICLLTGERNDLKP